MSIDLNENSESLPQADLLIADLFIEYIGYENFKKAVKLVNPKYVSCVIQVNGDKGFVSESEYNYIFDKLDDVANIIDAKKLILNMELINYIKQSQKEFNMPNGKKLIRIDFIRK